MSDARIRKLEREAAAGDVDARERLLLEQVRTGALSEERLRVAARFGDPAAGRAAGVESSFAPRNTQELVDLVWDLREGSKEVAVRVGLAAAIWHHDYRRRNARRLLDAIENWVSSPSEHTRRRVDRYAGAGRCHIACAHAAQAAASDKPSAYKWAALAAGRAAGGSYELLDTQERTPLMSSVAVERVSDAIRQDLLLWALGPVDPVKLRVEARKRKTPLTAGTRVQGRVVEHRSSGFLVDFGFEAILGLVRVSELEPLSQDSYPAVGAAVEAVILELDASKGRVLLALLDEA